MIPLDTASLLKVRGSAFGKFNTLFLRFMDSLLRNREKPRLCNSL